MRAEVGPFPSWVPAKAVTFADVTVIVSINLFVCCGTSSDLGAALGVALAPGGFRLGRL